MLELELFRNRFDNQVSLGDRLRQVGLGGQVRHSLVANLGGDLAQRDPFVQGGLDSLDGSCQRVMRHVEQDHVESGRRGHLGDAVPHGSRAEHCDVLNRAFA